MGRRSRGKKKPVNFSISEEHIVQLNLIFYDHTTGKPNYGARSQLVDALLGTWIADYNLKLRESVQNDPSSPSFRPADANPNSAAGGSEVASDPNPPGSDPLFVE